VDLSEGGYGVSLMNDCKYGFDIHENVIRMTLLRSPSYPDPKADVGHHQMTYSLLPHGREWRSETIPAAYALNFPQITFSSNSIVGERTTSRISRDSFFQIDQPNVIIETIKRAEDGNGLIIRVFENQRRRCECKLTTGFELSSVQRVNIIEEELNEISTEQDGFRFQIEPFQILSFRLIPGG
jgi:alpha-mannosidase